MGTPYATATIAADRGQRSFRLSLDQFLAKRGGSAIVARGRALKRSNAALFASIEQRYGVPPGPLLAIWGMETGFGAQRGNQNMLSAVATLAYDCRRSDFFTDQLYAALTLSIAASCRASTRGSMHGEIGHTQFLPKNVLNYGTGGSLDSAADALASTANFLKAHGWRPAPATSPASRISPPSRPGTPRRSTSGRSRMIGQQIDGAEARACAAGARPEPWLGSDLPLPGSAILRCCSASTPAGVTSAIAACSLFFQPVTTSPSPFIIASKPVLATSAGSSFLRWPTLVSSMSARSKNSVSVAPGIRQVTVTPVSFSSCAQRERERVEERLGAVVDRLEGARHEAGDRAGDQDAALRRASRMSRPTFWIR